MDNMGATWNTVPPILKRGLFDGKHRSGSIICGRLYILRYLVYATG
jgi:hypothetical protein